MSDYSTVGRPYAKALFDIAAADETLAGWSQGLNAAAAVVANGDAKRALTDPELDAEQRAKFVADVCGGIDGAEIFGTAPGRNLLRLLAENDRLAALEQIAEQFDRLKAHAQNKIKVTLVAAHSVDDALAAKVAQALEHKLGRKVELELEVDRSLLGGAVLRAEDRVIDGSVKSRLKRLAETLVD
jgi:F-type H+-transporting ATPase subunit delta